MKILVTGGAGFIGSHVVDQLLAGQHDVIIIDDFSTGSLQHVNKGARLYKMDVRSKDILPVFDREHFDGIIHLAAQTSVPTSLADPYNDADINISGTINILEACRKTGVKKIVFASSAAVYGNTAALPVTEDEPAIPTSFYGLSKLTVERYLDLYNRIYGLHYVVLRYANVYGERQGDAGEGGVISIFTRLIAAGKPLTVFGDGGQTRDFIYVGDVAAANCCAVLADEADFTANVSTKTQVSINAMIDIMKGVSGHEITVDYAVAREGDIYHSMLDNARITSALPWQPKMPLAEGLARTYSSLTE